MNAPTPQTPAKPAGTATGQSQHPATPGTIHKPAQGQTTQAGAAQQPATAPAGQGPAPTGQSPAPTGEATAATDGQTEGEKKKKAKKEKTGVPRPRLAKFDETHVITVLRPKAKIRESGKRFDEYVNGMTVKAYIDKMTAEPFKRTVGQVYADLRWDTDPNRKLINIGPTVVPIPEPPPPKEKKEKAPKAEAKTEAEQPKPAA